MFSGRFVPGSINLLLGLGDLQAESAKDIIQVSALPPPNGASRLKGRANPEFMNAKDCCRRNLADCVAL